MLSEPQKPYLSNPYSITIIETGPYLSRELVLAVNKPSTSG